VIKGEVSLMRRMGQVDEESLSSVEAEVDRLTRMVGDLLLLAQAETGRLPWKRSRSSWIRCCLRFSSTCAPWPAIS
jgi:signal transduction histidine kinase